MRSMQEKDNPSPTDQPTGIIETDVIHDAKRRSFMRNASVFVAFEAIWSIGVPCCLLATVVPTYLLELGASKTLIQSIVIGMSLLTFLQLWSGNVFGGSNRKIRQFFGWSIFALCWILYGTLATLAWPYFPVKYWIFLFCLLYVVLMFIIYLINPSYLEMIIENTPLKWRGRLTSMRSFGSGLFGLAGLWLVARLMEARPAPINFHICFIVGGIMYLTSCFLIFFIRDTVQPSAHTTHNIRAAFAVGKKLTDNFNFRVFLVFYAFYVIAQCFAPLFIGYGKDIIGMSAAGLTRFTMAYYAGIFLIGITVPLLADRSGFRIIAHIGSLLLGGAYLLPLLMPHSSLALLAAYAMLSGSVNLGSVILVNLGAELVPAVKPATIIAVSSTLFMPILLLAGPLSGKLTDLYGAGGYMAVFVSGISLAFCALLGFMFLVREPRTGQEIYVRLRGI